MRELIFNELLILEFSVIFILQISLTETEESVNFYFNFSGFRMKHEIYLKKILNEPSFLCLSCT